MNRMDHETHDAESKELIKQNIARYGWHVVLVNATGYLPSFAYTIGLWQTYEHPEIISFGLKTDTLHSILNIAGAEMEASKDIEC